VTARASHAAAVSPPGHVCTAQCSPCLGLHPDPTRAAFTPNRVGTVTGVLGAVQGQRWAAIEQLVQGVAPIPWSPPAEVDHAAQPCDDWAEALLYAAALVHVRASSFRCIGYTTLSSGRARCGSCSWTMSARMGDAGTFMSARFALAALARVGQAIALAADELVQALFEAVLPWA
jgi:hypothetical protein